MEVKTDKRMRVKKRRRRERGRRMGKKGRIGKGEWQLASQLDWSAHRSQKTLQPLAQEHLKRSLALVLGSGEGQRAIHPSLRVTLHIIALVTFRGSS